MQPTDIIAYNNAHKRWHNKYEKGQKKRSEIKCENDVTQ